MWIISYNSTNNLKRKYAINFEFDILEIIYNSVDFEILIHKLKYNDRKKNDLFIK